MYVCLCLPKGPGTWWCERRDQRRIRRQHFIKQPKYPNWTWRKFCRLSQYPVYGTVIVNFWYVGWYFFPPGPTTTWYSARRGYAYESARLFENPLAQQNACLNLEELFVDLEKHGVNCFFLFMEYIRVNRPWSIRA